MRWTQCVNKYRVAREEDSNALQLRFCMRTQKPDNRNAGASSLDDALVRSNAYYNRC